MKVKQTVAIRVKLARDKIERETNVYNEITVNIECGSLTEITVSDLIQTKSKSVPLFRSV